MKPLISYRNTFNKWDYFLVSLILFVITTNVEGARLLVASTIKSEIGVDLPTFCHQQILKAKASHPLSNVNFNKTRPRGISAQEPVVKYSLLCGPIIIYPPYLSGFTELDSFLSYSLVWGNTCSIRPPPSH